MTLNNAIYILWKILSYNMATVQVLQDTPKNAPTWKTYASVKILWK